MKRFFSLFLIFAVFLAVPGCQQTENPDAFAAEEFVSIYERWEEGEKLKEQEERLSHMGEPQLQKPEEHSLILSVEREDDAVTITYREEDFRGIKTKWLADEEPCDRSFYTEKEYYERLLSRNGVVVAGALDGVRTGYYENDENWGSYFFTQSHLTVERVWKGEDPGSELTFREEYYLVAESNETEYYLVFYRNDAPADPIPNGESHLFFLVKNLEGDYVNYDIAPKPLPEGYEFWTEADYQAFLNENLDDTAEY